MSKLYTACDQRICNCPEWTVVKNKFIMVDDWNASIIINLCDVDSVITSAIYEPNAAGVILYHATYTDFYKVVMTKDQLKQFVKDWQKFNKKNTKLLMESQNEN